ncbi:MAG: type II toxin-antitoxin system HicA family toxin [Bacillota bacterium]|jgi:predicted RNA binding protein YcfA (HicA-like mRNA interferase family)
MTRMPRVTGKKVVSALKSAGFIVVKVTGSHHHLHKPGSRLVTVPVHSGETTKDEIPVLQTLCEAILEYVYQAPALVERMALRIEELKLKTKD